MERLKTATAKKLAETLTCFSFDLISLMGEYANELRFSHSIVLKRTLNTPCQTAVILNEHGKTLFQCEKTLEYDDDHDGQYQHPWCSSFRRIAYHNHSGILYLFDHLPGTYSVISHYPSLADMKYNPKIVKQSSWDRHTMGICTESFREDFSWVIGVNKQEICCYYPDGDGAFLYPLNDLHLTEDIIHIAITKQRDFVLCTKKQVIKYSGNSKQKSLFLYNGIVGNPVCVAVDTKDNIYVLRNSVFDREQIMLFNKDGVLIQTLQCSKDSVWMQFIYDQLFVFQSNGTREVFKI